MSNDKSSTNTNINRSDTTSSTDNDNSLFQHTPQQTNDMGTNSTGNNDFFDTRDNEYRHPDNNNPLIDYSTSRGQANRYFTDDSFSFEDEEEY